MWFKEILLVDCLGVVLIGKENGGNESCTNTIMDCKGLERVGTANSKRQRLFQIFYIKLTKVINSFLQTNLIVIF